MNANPKHPKWSAISDNLPMIIVLDTTVVLSDPQLRAAWWTTLKDTAKRHGARIVVPEVVVVEAVANQRRSLETLSDRLSTTALKEKRFGVDSICEAITAAVDVKTTAFARELRGHLSSLGSEFVAPPAIDHLDLVNRAVAFRKPWDESERKDGYRDTLNWLTVLDIAESNPGHEVWWISQNSKDFGAGDDEENSTKWHNDINDELMERGLEERVSWAHDVASLMSVIAEKTAPVGDEEKDEFVAKILEKELFGYVVAELVGYKLDPKSVGAEGSEDTAEIRFVTDLTGIEWESLAGDGDGGFVARFVGSAGVGINATTRTSDAIHAYTRSRRAEVIGVANLNSNASVMAVSITSVDVRPSEVDKMVASLMFPPKGVQRSAEGSADESPFERSVAALLRTKFDFATGVTAKAARGEEVDWSDLSDVDVSRLKEIGATDDMINSFIVNRRMSRKRKNDGDTDNREGGASPEPEN